MTATFYDVLGVDEDATTDEIEAAYRERLKETHPDVSDDDDAGQATKTLIEARDVLVDDDERARYDRVGHEAYVGTEPEPSASGATDDQPSSASEEGGDGGQTRDRASRERRASERVREERRRAHEARQASRERRERDDAAADASESATDEETTDGDGASRTRRRSHVAGAADETATETTYSVREEVATPRSHGQLLPTGREFTLLGIFFALYPVLLFSALLPAFPSFVNVVLSACTLLMIGYLQSMPRVALPLFGGWSAISLVAIGVFQIGYLSIVGLVALAGTILPFGFSVLTASALRY